MNDERPLITVEESRPCMLAWNGAFESSRIPRFVGEENFVRAEAVDYGTWAVPDICKGSKKPKPFFGFD